MTDDDIGDRMQAVWERADAKFSRMAELMDNVDAGLAALEKRFGVVENERLCWDEALNRLTQSVEAMGYDMNARSWEMDARLDRLRDGLPANDTGASPDLIAAQTSTDELLTLLERQVRAL